MKGFLKVVLVSIVGLYLAVVAVMALIQRPLQYPADPRRPDIAQAGLPGLEEFEIQSSDGERLVTWHVPPRRADAPVFLYFHGNAGNMGRPIRLERLQRLTEDGSGILAIHYRGYGGSTGSPTEAGLHRDARAAWLEAARRYGPSRLVAYGESLGTGVATRLVLTHDVAALILDAPYTSTADVAFLRYPFLPVYQVMIDQFPTRQIIGQVRVPVLVLHGTEDRTIPVEQGIEVAARAPAPSRLVVFAGGGHETLPRAGSIPEIRAFLADAAAGRIAGRERRDLQALAR
jgi:uncharacterized protein